MAIAGRKQLSYHDRKKLYRTKPRQVRNYSNDITSQYKELIDSFTLQDYKRYEELLHTIGTQGRKRHVMLDKCLELGITGNLLEMAKLRAVDLNIHQRLMIVLRHRWTNIWEIRKSKDNADVLNFWNRMARSIQARCKDTGYELYEEWQGTNGRLKLAEFLENQYKKQNGHCAISKEKMTFETGTKKRNPSKCSPDRKSSNSGYTPKNLWLVASWVNSMKLDTSLITFWKRIDQLAEARKYNIEQCKNKPRYKIN